MFLERRKRLVQEQGGTYLTFGFPNTSYLQHCWSPALFPPLLNRMGDLPRNFSRNRYQETKQKQKASVHNTAGELRRQREGSLDPRNTQKRHKKVVSAKSCGYQHLAAHRPLGCWGSSSWGPFSGAMGCQRFRNSHSKTHESQK